MNMFGISLSRNVFLIHREKYVFQKVLSRSYGQAVKLSEKEVEVLKDSLKEVEGKAGCYGSEFFKELFKTHPDYANFFKKWGEGPDALLKNKKFIKEHAAGNVIKALVHLLRDIHEPKKTEECAAFLGQKHIIYCVGKKHFKNAKKALLKILETNFDDKWSCEMENAWKKALNIVFTGLYKGLEAKK